MKCPKMRKVIKGTQFTEVITRKKGEFQETVQYWVLKNPRPIEECGVWIDGKQVVFFNGVEYSTPLSHQVHLKITERNEN